MYAWKPVRCQLTRSCLQELSLQTEVMEYLFYQVYADRPIAVYLRHGYNHRGIILSKQPLIFNTKVSTVGIICNIENNIFYCQLHLIAKCSYILREIRKYWTVLSSMVYCQICLRARKSDEPLIKSTFKTLLRHGVIIWHILSNLTEPRRKKNKLVKIIIDEWERNFYVWEWFQIIIIGLPRLIPIEHSFVTRKELNWTEYTLHTCHPANCKKEYYLLIFIYDVWKCQEICYLSAILISMHWIEHYQGFCAFYGQSSYIDMLQNLYDTITLDISLHLNANFDISNNHRCCKYSRNKFF